MKLNLGCGSHKKEGYLNIDAGAGSKPDKVYDLKRIGRHFEAGSIDEICGLHMLEHFSEAEGISLLQTCYSLLKSGGVLYLELPDFEGVLREYLKSEGLKHPILKQRIFGMQRNLLDFHKWGYTKRELKAVLYSVGFIDVKTDNANLSEFHGGPCLGMRAKKC